MWLLDCAKARVIGFDLSFHSFDRGILGALLEYRQSVVAHLFVLVSLRQMQSCQA